MRRVPDWYPLFSFSNGEVHVDSHRLGFRSLGILILHAYTVFFTHGTVAFSGS